MYFSIYYVILKGLKIDNGLIYPFLNKPGILNTNFLGYFEIGSKSLILAISAGITQFIQGYLASPVPVKNEIEITTDKPNNNEASFQDTMASSMQMNIKYFLPLFIAYIAWQISAAVALYFITSNIFTIVQEWYIRKTLEEKK